jgi:hypothetical protein
MGDGVPGVAERSEACHEFREFQWFTILTQSRQEHQEDLPSFAVFAPLRAISLSGNYAVRRVVSAFLCGLCAFACYQPERQLRGAAGCICLPLRSLRLCVSQNRSAEFCGLWRRSSTGRLVELRPAYGRGRATMVAKSLGRSPQAISTSSNWKKMSSHCSPASS